MQAAKSTLDTQQELEGDGGQKEKQVCPELEDGWEVEGGEEAVQYQKGMRVYFPFVSFIFEMYVHVFVSFIKNFF